MGCDAVCNQVLLLPVEHKCIIKNIKNIIDSLLSMDTACHSVDELNGDAVDGGPMEFLVELCLQLHVNEKTDGRILCTSSRKTWNNEGVDVEVDSNHAHAAPHPA